MKQQTGAATAILLAATAIIGYSALPLRNSSHPAPTGEAAQGVAGKGIEPPLQDLKSLKAPCREIEERIEEFLAENPVAENGGKLTPHIFAPENCFEQTSASVDPKARVQVSGTINVQIDGTTSSVSMTSPPVAGPSSSAGGSSSSAGATATPTPHETAEAEEKGAQLRFIIATLPNPVHTHLSLEFDRMMEALQQAAQDQGYNYDSSWLPWVDHARQYGSFSDEKQEEARQSFQEKQPGLLVFRKSLPLCPQHDGERQDAQTVQQAANCAGEPYREGLLVFVVGENATGGIDGDQFQNAISWIEALRPRGTGRNLRVLGPFFSGSFPSLAHLLTTGNTKKYIDKNTASISDAPKTNVSAVEVFSGDASSDLGIHWFSSFLKGKKLGHFTTFQESDDLVINRYCRLLTQQGYDTGRLAIISEDETAYGAIGANAQVIQPKPADNPDPSLYECIQHERDENRGPLNLYYPRDIAALRSAYEKQSLLVSRSSAHSGLTETLAESDSSDHDTIRTYGGDQATLSQEAALFSLVNLLKAHHIEFIVLRSSNSLDQLFLTQFFGQTYSDARVVILNSDQMFRRGADNPGFRGTMTLSTYPLLTWQQDWTFFQRPQSRHSHRTFSDASAEGIYLASRFLINLQDSELALDSPCDTLSLLASNINCPKQPEAASSVLVQDYGLPSWLITDATLPTHPPTWLSVIGGGQVWPVAIIDEATLPETLPAPVVDYGAPQDDKTPFGKYYVWVSYVDDLGRSSALSPASSIWVCPEWLSWVHRGCSTLTVRPPTIPPTWATKYKIYIRSATGSEILQVEKPIAAGYIHSGPLKMSSAETISPGPVAPDRSLLNPVYTDVYTDAHPNQRDLLILPLSIRICFSLVVLWCSWHLYCCWAGSQTAFPRCRAYFAPMRGPQHNVLIFFGCFLVALAAITMAVFTGSLYSGSSPFMHQWRMTFLYCALGMLSLTALIRNYGTLPAGPKSPETDIEKAAKEEYERARRDEKKAVRAEAEKTQQRRKCDQPGVGDQLWGKRIFKAFWRKKVWIRKHPVRWLLRAGFLLLLASCLQLAIFYLALASHTGDWNRVFTYWRSVNVFSGVSPLMPFLLLIGGMYGWFWYTLAGLALFNRDRPRLPHCDDLDPRLVMFSREQGRKIERLAKPLTGGYGIVLPVLFLGLVGSFIFFTESDEFSIRSLGSRSYGWLFFVWLCVCVALIITDAFQMLRIWSRLRQLLVFLNHLPARRTLHVMKGFSWGTVWKMGGGVLQHRYKLFWRQMESFRHLRNELQRLTADDIKSDGEGASAPSSEHPEHLPPLKPSFYKRLDTCDASSQLFVSWFIRSYQDPNVTNLCPVRRHQDEVAKTAAAVCNDILLGKWRGENHSLIQELCEPGKEAAPSNNPELSSSTVPEFQRLAEEFFLLPYLGFIQNILGRMRTLAIGMLWLFVAATLSVASYPFDPRPVLGGMFLFVFLVVGAIITFVYAEMHRNATLSYITNTNPGELGIDFWIKLISLGAAPLAALLTAYFPELAGFLTSWVQPSVGNIK